MKDHFPVICAGGSLTSYLCAARLARAGKKVLVVDEGGASETRVRDGRYLFDPDYPLFSGLEAGTSLGVILREVGLWDAIGEGLPPGFAPLDTVSQVLTPEHRIVFSSDEKSTTRELSRELQQGAAETRAFFEKLYQAGAEIPSFVAGATSIGQAEAGEVSRWKRFWGPFHRAVTSSRPLRLGDCLPDGVSARCELLSAAMLGSLSYAMPSNLGCEQGIRSLPLFLRGQHCYIEGAAGLKRRLAEVILSCGGSVRTGTRAESLIAESGRVRGVLLSSYEGIVRGDAVVVTTGVRRLYRTLPEDVRDATQLRALRRVEPGSWRFTILVVARADSIPVGVTSNMVFVGSRNDPMEEENFLKIQILPRRDEESVSILVTALVPYRASAMDYAYLRRMGGRMLRSLTELLPFLEENLITIYPDIRSGTAELEECYPFAGEEWVPENLMQYYVRGHYGAQDFWGPSWASHHRDLYFGGRVIWPALGAYGEALAAKRISDALLNPKADS